MTKPKSVAPPALPPNREDLAELVDDMSNEVGHAVQQLEYVARMMRASAMGVPIERVRPLEVLERAGMLDQALTILECMATQPGMVTGLLELVVQFEDEPELAEQCGTFISDLHHVARPQPAPVPMIPDSVCSKCGKPGTHRCDGIDYCATHLIDLLVLRGELPARCGSDEIVEVRVIAPDAGVTNG